MGALRQGRVLGLAAAVAAGAAAAAVLVVGRGSSAPGIAPTAPLAVHASFEPPTVQFGDPVTARVVVLLDRALARAETLKITDDLAPLTQLGPARTTRTTRGRLTVVSISVPAACLTDPCVARPGETRLELPRVTAAVSAADDRVLRAGTAWPVLRVQSRVTAADLAPVRPPFRADASPPPPSYRIAPATLARLFEALAALLAVAGAGLVVYQVGLLAHRRRRASPALGELEDALRLAREAEARPAPDRRRALSLVARLLEARNRRLAGAARELAWSEPKPEPRALSELVSEIEREVPS